MNPCLGKSPDCSRSDSGTSQRIGWCSMDFLQPPMRRSLGSLLHSWAWRRRLDAYPQGCRCLQLLACLWDQIRCPSNRNHTRHRFALQLPTSLQASRNWNPIWQDSLCPHHSEIPMGWMPHYWVCRAEPCILHWPHGEGQLCHHHQWTFDLMSWCGLNLQLELTSAFSIHYLLVRQLIAQLNQLIDSHASS